jgi:hypothetical protein
VGGGGAGGAGAAQYTQSRAPRIVILDTDQNWLNWGRLVEAWINGATYPTTVGQLRQQLSQYNVAAAIEGPDSRQVSIRQYAGAPNYPLYIYIPDQQMLAAKFGLATPGRYPRALMPSFYDLAYEDPVRRELSPQEAQEFAIRRVGEYTVNECC